MAKKSTRRRTGEPGEGGGANTIGAPMSGSAGQPTGRYLVTYKDGAARDAQSALQSLFGLRGAVAATADFGDDIDANQLATASSVVLSELGIQILAAAPAANIQSLAALESHPAIEAVEPEYFVEAIDHLDGRNPSEYARGFRDASSALYRGLHGAVVESDAAEDAALATFSDTAAFTWGLQATGVTRTRYSGRGIKVAVLDTGHDLRHPDFGGRVIVPQSFVPGVGSVQDGHSHGTHCIGTALGPATPPRPPGSRRYGCAPGADIFVGKVLNDGGGGMAGWALAGIDWAVRRRCQVVSMSLGWIISPSHPDSVAFEAAGRRALRSGTLVIAAAGNEGPGGGLRSPANVASVMAVGAVDQSLGTASFSSRGDVNIAGPGVATYSSVPMPGRYGLKNGTSMACPHVAGIAALWAQSNPVFRGSTLWRVLLAKAKPLPAPANQVGKGLVQAP